MSTLRRNFLQQVVVGAASVLGGVRTSEAVAPSKPAVLGSVKHNSPSTPPVNAGGSGGPDPIFEKPTPITVSELLKMKIEGVRAVEVSDYVFGNYKGDFPSPPHADQNPKKAIIIVWEGACSIACTVWNRTSRRFGRCRGGGWTKERIVPGPKASKI